VSVEGTPERVWILRCEASLVRTGGVTSVATITRHRRPPQPPRGRTSTILTLKSPFGNSVTACGCVIAAPKMNSHARTRVPVGADCSVDTPTQECGSVILRSHYVVCETAQTSFANRNRTLARLFAMTSRSSQLRSFNNDAHFTLFS
jgi:hypothetical protein